MKKVTLLLAAFALLGACKNSTNPDAEKAATKADASQEESQAELNYYGDTISPEGALTVDELRQRMEEGDSIPAKVAGTINSSCQKKGCWMKMDMGDGEEMRVSFRDYSFFVPKNLNGETGIIEGHAYIDTIDVEFLRHLAEDAGKSEEEIAQIDEPEVSVNFVADGVIIKS